MLTYATLMYNLPANESLKKIHQRCQHTIPQDGLSARHESEHAQEISTLQQKYCYHLSSGGMYPNNEEARQKSQKACMGE